MNGMGGSGGAVGTGGHAGNGGSGAGGAPPAPAYLSIVGGDSVTIAVGDTAYEGIIVTNTGQQTSGAVTISVLGDAAFTRGPDSVSPKPICVDGVTTVSPGASCYLMIQFQPLSFGTYNGAVLASWVGGTATSRLSFSSMAVLPASGIVKTFPLPGIDATDVAYGSDDNIWFADYDNNRIGSMTRAGTPTLYSVPTPNSGPGRITAGPDNNLWFTETLASRIGRITPSGTITEFVCPTSSSSPFGITTGPDGNLWYAAAGGIIGRVTTTTGAITEFPAMGLFPRGITVGPDHNLWFADGTGNVGRMTTTGVITKFPVPSPNLQPIAITTGSDGNLWYTNGNVANNASVVGRMTPTGMATEFAVDWSSLIDSIVAGPDNNIWATVSTNVVVRFAVDGTRTNFTVATDPMGITAGRDGNIWIAAGPAISRITP